jgi:transcriptional regulator with XRE-family HTH domain
MDKTLILLEKIKIARKGKGITQEDMANRLGINKIAYNRIENGKTKLSLDRVVHIIDIIGGDFIKDFDNEVFPLKNESVVEVLKTQIKELEKQLSEKQLLIDLLREKRDIGLDNDSFVHIGDEYLIKWISSLDEEEKEVIEKIQNNSAIRKLLEKGELRDTKYYRVWVEHFKK